MMIDRFNWWLVNGIASGRGPRAVVVFIVVASAAVGFDAWQSIRRAREVEMASVRPQPAVPVESDPQKLQAQADALLARLPAYSEYTTQVKALFEAAESAGIVLDRGEYSYPPRGAGLVRSIHVVLPIKGEPTKIANFIAGIYAQFPSVALTAISFKRDSASAQLVQASLDLELFLDARNSR